MSKKVLNSAVIALLVLNVFTLGMLWVKSGKKHRPAPPPTEQGGLEHMLGFSDEQTRKFEALRERHGQESHELRKEIGALRESWIERIKAHDSDPRSADSLSAEIAQRVAQIEQITFAHFQDISDLCTDEQRVKFEHTLDHMARMLLSGGGPPPPPPGGPGPQHPHQPPHR